MERVYKKIELVGISQDGFDQAVSNAIERASKTIHGLAWFEVKNFHGKIANGHVTEYQAILSVAFKLEEPH